MTQPTAYDQTTSFDSFNPSSFPNLGRKLDVELENIETTTDEIRANLALIQRDDGALANDSVGPDQLENSVFAGINTPAEWVTATDYTVRDSVTIIVTGSSGYTKMYKCLVAHTSGVFATDLAAGYWELILQVDAGPTGPAGAGTAGTNTPTTITAGAGAVGVSTAFSREDHSHPSTVFTLAVGSVISAGGTTAAVNTRYPVSKTTSYTITLPAAPTQNDVVVFQLYGVGGTTTFGLNSLKYYGGTTNPATSGQGVIAFIYTDATTGWIDL